MYKDLTVQGMLLYNNQSVLVALFLGYIRRVRVGWLPYASVGSFANATRHAGSQVPIGPRDGGAVRGVLVIALLGVKRYLGCSVWFRLCVLR